LRLTRVTLVTKAITLAIRSGTVWVLAESGAHRMLRNGTSLRSYNDLAGRNGGGHCGDATMLKDNPERSSSRCSAAREVILPRCTLTRGSHRTIDPHAEQRWPTRSCPSPVKADLCVSVSRGRYDAKIYANNAATLGQEPVPDVSHSHAIQKEPAMHFWFRELDSASILNQSRRRSSALTATCILNLAWAGCCRQMPMQTR